MPSKKRGGLSQREYQAQLSGKPMPYGVKKSSQVLKGAKSPVMDTASAKKAASSSVTKESNALARAQKEYIASLTPSSEELAATTAQQNLLMGQEQETRKIGKQTIASPFIERQTERLASDVSEQTIPLKYQIAALQSQREARSNIAQAKYKYADDVYSRKAEQAKAVTKKEVNPLDTEYKTLRNKRIQQLMSKTGRGSGKSDWENIRIQNDRRGNPIKVLERNRKTGEYRTNVLNKP